MEGYDPNLTCSHFNVDSLGPEPGIIAGFMVSRLYDETSQFPQFWLPKITWRK